MGPRARGLGLGKKLVRKSMDIARDLGCEYYFAYLSGIFSQKIYRDLGGVLMKEVAYADYNDKWGNEVFTENGVHKTAQTMYVKL